MSTAIRVIEKATGEVVEEIDVSNETDSDVRLIKTGLRINLNHAEYRLEEI